MTTPHEPSWAPDPSGRFAFRYWDGSARTEHVAQEGVQSTDADGVGAANRRKAPRAVSTGCLGSAASFVTALVSIFIAAAIADSRVNGENNPVAVAFAILCWIALIAMVVFLIMFLAGSIVWASHRLRDRANGVSP